MLGFNKKTQDASPQENTGGENKVFHFIKTHKKRCIAVVAAAAVLVAGIVRRNGQTVIPSGNDSLQEGDDVVIVTTDTTLHSLRDIVK